LETQKDIEAQLDILIEGNMIYKLKAVASPVLLKAPFRKIRKRKEMINYYHRVWLERKREKERERDRER